jgi:predicted ATPase
MIDWCNIQGKLYDKSDQIEQLLQAYRRQTRQQEDPMHQQDNDESLLVSLTSASLATPSHQFTNEFVLITGPSGVGKTALACTLQEQVEQDGGYFIRGKFEQPTTITDDLAEIGATLATGPEQQQQQQRQQQQVANSAMTPVHDNNTGPFATALSQYASLAILKARQRQRLRRRQLRDQCSTGVAITSSSNCNKDNELESLQIALERELDTSELQVLAENIPALQPILINNHQHNINNDNNTVTSTAGSDKDSSHPPNHPTTTATTTTTTATTSGGWRGLQGPDAEKYYRHMLSKFVTAIRNTTTMSHPLVLLLDDLQWADQRSLELIQMMLTRQSNHASSGLVILATVRSLLEEEQPSSSNNIHQTTNDNNHPTSNNALVFSLLQELQEHGVGTTHLQVSNLGQDAVQELMSDLFQHASRECNALLADRVHRLTGGNVFFIFQLLRFWEGEGRLMMCGSDDDDGDDRKVAALPYPLYQMINDDIPSVMELVVKRIQQLPFNVQEVLKMASCMGTIISERLLKEAGSVGMSPLSIEPALAVAHEQGLVVYDSSSTTESVSFVHDKIQKAAYSLIPESERAMLHLHIGRALWVWLAYEELDRHIFLVTNQITRGLHLVDDPVEKEELAELYLRAGLKTAQSTLFTQASAYFEMGISLLGRRHWKRHYKLSLDLYNAAAEVEYYGGNLVRVDFLLNRVLRHAKSLDDKLHAYYTQIYSLASRDDTNQAFSIGFEVLRQLGVTFPERLRAIRTRVAWHNCIKKLRQMGDDSIIMNLPVMQDKRQLMIMRLLNTLMMSAFSARQELVVPMLISMVNRTLQHGICGASTFRFLLSACYFESGGAHSCLTCVLV